jgi:hypothetical protein
MLLQASFLSFTLPLALLTRRSNSNHKPEISLNYKLETTRDVFLRAEERHLVMSQRHAAAISEHLQRWHLSLPHEPDWQLLQAPEPACALCSPAAQV